MDYDNNLYRDYVINLLKKNYPTTDDREIGKNISILPNVKIIFDGYGNSVRVDDENEQYKYIEQLNTNQEAWVMFIHKDGLSENFVFPEHEKVAWENPIEGLPNWHIVRRPDDEVILWAWYHKQWDFWDVIRLEERIEPEDKMTVENVMEILAGLVNS
jgi:hypothetical protein